MTETAKLILERVGSFILNKKQTAKIIGKSESYITDAIRFKQPKKIPKWTQIAKGANIEFDIQDIAEFLETRRKQNQQQKAS